MLRQIFVRTMFVALIGLLLTQAPVSTVYAMCCPVPCVDCWMTSQGQLNFVQMDRVAGRVRLVPNIVLQGMADDFALIVPTPALPEFAEAPREIWEEARQMTRPLTTRSSSGDAFGCGANERAVLAPERDATSEADDVFVHSEQTVGAFEVTVISSNDPQALLTWLNEHGFTLAPEDEARFAPYVQRGWFFTTMKLDTSDPGNVMPPGGWNSDVNPVQITYEATEFELALPIIAVNRAPWMPVVVYVVDDHRMTLDGFTTLYANELRRTEYSAVQNFYPHLAPFLSSGRWFTALQRTFTDADAMNASLMMGRAPRDVEFRRGGARFGAIALSPLVLLLTLIVLWQWARRNRLTRR